MNKSRILLANNYFYLRGGSERYVFYLMDLLKGAGHEVVPFSTKNALNRNSPYADYFADPFDPDALADLSLAEKLKVAGRVLYSVNAKRRIGRLVDKVRPDLAHLHNIYGALSPSIIGAVKKRGLAVVLTLHDVKLLCPNHRMYVKHMVCERCKLNKFYECAINRCLAESTAASFLGSIEQYAHRISGIYRRNIDLFIAPSEFIRKKFVEYGFPEKMIVKIPNFIDAKDYEPTYDHDSYVIYFGRIEESKGITTLLAAAARLKGVVDFVIAGDGPMKAELKERIGRENLTHVKFAGHKAGKEMADLVKKAMFCVVPSELFENNPYSVFESFACGKAVVGSNIGGIPELIENNVTGLLFCPGDADDLAAKIKVLVNDPALALEMGRKARLRVEDDFGPEEHYSKIISAYGKVL